MLMTNRPQKLAAALFLAVPLALTACSEEAPVVEEQAGIAGVTIENARLVLAPVQGNPAALYFDFAYEGDRAFNVDRFSIEGAESAVMHQYGEYDFKVQMMVSQPFQF